MSFYSLPLEKHNVKIPLENCYLVLCKYGDNHFKPQKDKKKLSADELKEKKKKLQEQQDTIKVLDSGHCNLHNRKITLGTIYDSSFASYLYDYDNYIIYKIKPLASNEVRNNYSYSKVTYEVSEFDVIKKFKNKEEVLKEIHNDRLLEDFSAQMFESLSYANEGYDIRLYDYFKYIKETFQGFEVSLEDIILSKDSYHAIRNNFSRKDTGKASKINIKYLLENGLVKYFKQYDYYKTEIIIALLDCGLYDVALHCTRLLEDSEIQNLKKNKDFDIVLRKWSNIAEVKEIINTLDITLSGIRLTVKDYHDKEVDVQDFKTIGEVKTFIIKNYDVSFEQVMSRDICDITSYDENDGTYTFVIS
jgi:hypothetical protein